MLRREMGSKRGSLPPKEGDLTCMPHNMTIFKFICVQYQFHGQTLPIMKIDRGKIQF